MVLLSLLDTLETRTWNWLGRVIWAHLTSEHLTGKSLRAKGLPPQVDLKVALTMNWCVFSIIAEHIKTTALVFQKFSHNPNRDKTMCFPAEKLFLNLPKLVRILALRLLWQHNSIRCWLSPSNSEAKLIGNTKTADSLVFPPWLCSIWLA